jgi:hypothetical protein
VLQLALLVLQETILQVLGLQYVPHVLKVNIRDPLANQSAAIVKLAKARANLVHWYAPTAASLIIHSLDLIVVTLLVKATI